MSFISIVHRCAVFTIRLICGLHLHFILQAQRMSNLYPNRPIPGIYSTSLLNLDQHDPTTIYRPLRKGSSPNQLTIDSPVAYNSRARANTNIIERRFSNVELPIPFVEQLCK